MNYYSPCLFSTFVFLLCGNNVFACSGGGRKEATDYSRSSDSQCDFSLPESRLDCGYSGITKPLCESKGCCYDPQYPRSNNCFYKEIDLQSCLNVIRHYDQHTSWNGMTWFSLDLSRDSRQGVISQRSKISDKDDSEHDELRKRKKRALTLYCPDYDYGTRIVFAQVLLALRNQVGNGIGDITIVRPNDRTNPIQESYMRRITNAVSRVEAVHAIIRREHVNPNNRRDFPDNFSDHMRNNLGAQPGDERFHLVASEISGPPELYNMVPVHRSLNRNYHVLPENRMNDWRSVERAIRFHAENGNGFVDLTVFMYHDHPLAGRPDHITYQAIFYDPDGREVRFISGASRNHEL